VRRSSGPAPGPRACGEPGQRFGRGEPERDRREMACQVADLVLPEGGRPDFQLGGVGSSYQAPFVQGRGGLAPRAGEASPARWGSPRRPSSAARARSQSGVRAPRSQANGCPPRSGTGTACRRRWSGMEFRLRLRGPETTNPGGTRSRLRLPGESTCLTTKLATCPSAWTPASVRAAPCTCHSLAEQLGERVLQGLLHGREPRLPLPAADGAPSYESVNA